MPKQSRTFEVDLENTEIVDVGEQPSKEAALEVAKNMNKEVEKTQDAPVEKNKPEPFRIAIVGGKNDLAKATKILYSSPRSDVRVLEIDEVKQFDPIITMVCHEIKLSKNDLQEDAELLDAVKKLSYLNTGICIRTTVSPETLDRIMSCMPAEAANSRIIYSPEIESTFDRILNCPVSLIGGNDASVEQHIKIIKNLTIDSRPHTHTAPLLDICMVKLLLSGRRAVLQEFYNQMFQFICEWDLLGFGSVRKILNSISDTEHLYSVPVSIRALEKEDGITPEEALNFKGEYENTDVRALIGITDKMILVEEAINSKNLR